MVLPETLAFNETFVEIDNKTTECDDYMGEKLTRKELFPPIKYSIHLNLIYLTSKI